MRSFVLGLDILGGDHPPESYIPALATLLDSMQLPQRLALFVTPAFSAHWYEGALASYLEHPALWVIPVSESVQMKELPLHALRHKKDSSLMQGIMMLRTGELDALVSTGNTGALVAAATLQLPLLPGSRRLGLLARLPTRGGAVSVIDVGATLEPTPSDLMQWTKLGVEHLGVHDGLHTPRVGLLNIGSESYKGTPLQQAAHVLLSQYPGIHFMGNVESEEVYQGAVDLLITDGYSGNIFLKTSEAVRDLIYSELTDQLKTESFKINLNQLSIPPMQTASAYLLGTPYCVMKCHGSLHPSRLASVVRNVYMKSA